jgi:hypothetical protein
MQSRARLVILIASLAALFLAQAAAAGPVESRGSAVRARSRLALERKFESAMAHMDRDLVALLGSRTMVCAGEDVARGLETCWVALESTTAAEVSRDAAHD